VKNSGWIGRGRQVKRVTGRSGPIQPEL